MSDSVIFLMGPTASGKTALAIDLVQHHNCEIVSVDSALVYKQMDVGTAKPSEAELALAPHRLINILDPSESYSAADFRRDALREIADIQRLGKRPLLVGGTMLYFKALRDGLAGLPPADDSVRADIEAYADKHGWPAVHKQLEAVDAVTAERLAPNDKQRIQRALEVFRVSGKPLSVWHQEQQAQTLPFDYVSMCVAPSSRAVLHERIERRFLQMLEQGFVDEVRALYDRGDLHTGLPSVRAVGYRQVWDYIEGKLSYDEMVERGIIATRQLAKRQMTWLRSWEDLHWFETNQPDLLSACLRLLT